MKKSGADAGGRRAGACARRLAVLVVALLAPLQALAHRGTAPGDRSGLEIAGVTHGEMAVVAGFAPAIRAVAQDPMAATLVGVDTKRTYAMAFGLGVALTAFGGAVILPYITVSPTVGGQFVVLMFTVVVLGGLGSVAGALAGGIMVGIVQSLSALVFPIQLQNLCLFVIFIAVLALRPQGLIKGA